jgi:hypothetical protein
MAKVRCPLTEETTVVERSQMTRVGTHRGLAKQLLGFFIKG